jgi:hypothetical protein
MYFKINKIILYYNSVPNQKVKIKEQELHNSLY